MSKPKFTRGYNESRDKVSKSLAYSRSCFNCGSFYQASGDKEEVCQNNNVTQFDMVVTQNNIYCAYWRPVKKNDEKSLFKKVGRDRLE